MTKSECEKEICAWCQMECSLACTSCNKVYYCNKEHQKKHWQQHKDICRPWIQVENDEMGRYLVAQRDIPAGTLIIKESPFVLGPQACSAAVCLECNHPLCAEKMDRCALCFWPVCSQTCAVTKSHINECFFLRRDTKRCGVPTGPGETPRYDLILVLRCLLLRITNRSSYKKLMKLASHAQKRKEEGEPHHVAAIRYLKEVCRLENEEDEIHHVRGAIITNSVNSRSKYGVTLRGLYATVSLLNHSCTPNLTLRTDKHHTVYIHTTTDVKSGEPLVFSYVSPFSPIWIRQLELHNIYYFQCVCKRCNDPNECGIFFSSFKCFNCSNSLIVHNGDYSSTWKCNSCGFETGLDKIRDQSNEVKASLDKMPETLAEIKSFLDDTSKFCHENHALYVEAMQKALVNLRKCSLPEVYETKLNIWKNLLALYKLLEPGSTRRTGASLLEVSKIILDNAENNKDGNDRKKDLEDALKYTDEAISILSIEPPESTEIYICDVAKQIKNRIKKLIHN